MFTDTVSLRVRAGRGGRGSASFRAQPFEPQGGPDGGNGGSGGDVVVRATRDLHDLSPLVQRAQLAATGDLLADLAADGDTAVVARGGSGGGGNIHRASSVNRTPTAAGPGDAGEQRELRLELWLPADVALVGKPNAGKSTLLSALTSARPKIADYAYTTPYPELGVMFAGTGRPTTLVEIPSERYVRHIERTRAVALVVDARHPEDLKSIRPLAGDRPAVVIWTKSDLLVGPHRRRGVWVSAETGVGVEELRAAILEALTAAPPRQRREVAPRRLSLTPLSRGAAIEVERRDWGLEVAGKRVERLLERYDLDTPDGFDRFQVALNRMGVTAALEEAGAEPGETVRIGDAEFEYQP